MSKSIYTFLLIGALSAAGCETARDMEEAGGKNRECGEWRVREVNQQADPDQGITQKNRFLEISKNGNVYAVFYLDSGYLRIRSSILHDFGTSVITLPIMWVEQDGNVLRLQKPYGQSPEDYMSYTLSSAAPGELSGCKVRLSTANESNRDLDDSSPLSVYLHGYVYNIDITFSKSDALEGAPVQARAEVRAISGKARDFTFYHDIQNGQTLQLVSFSSMFFNEEYFQYDSDSAVISGEERKYFKDYKSQLIPFSSMNPSEAALIGNQRGFVDSHGNQQGRRPTVVVKDILLNEPLTTASSGWIGDSSDQLYPTDSDNVGFWIAVVNPRRIPESWSYTVTTATF